MSEILLITGSGACFLYFIACGLYAGFRASFLGIWPAAAIVLAFFAVLIHLQKLNKMPFKIPGAVKMAFLVFLMAGILLFAVMESLIVSKMFSKGEKNLDVIIVLGAQVRGDHVSRALEDRLRAAEDYLEENPETKAFLSGGQGPGENLTEAGAMYDWLTEHGISKERLIKEDRSTSTWENVTFCKKMLEGEKKDLSVGIVTNNFHVYRGVMLARAAGFKDVCGIAAESHSLLQLHYLVREAIALAKDIVRFKL